MFTSRMAVLLSKLHSTLQSDLALGCGVHVGGIEAQLHIGLVAKHRLVAKFDANGVNGLRALSEQFLFEKELAHAVHRCPNSLALGEGFRVRGLVEQVCRCELACAARDVRARPPWQ